MVAAEWEEVTMKIDGLHSGDDADRKPGADPALMLILSYQSKPNVHVCRTPNISTSVFVNVNV